MTEWLIVELTPRGEKEPPEVLRTAASRALRGAEVYVPAVETRIGDDKAVHFLMSGYIFVQRDGRSDKEYKRHFENTRLFNSLLTKGRQLATVESSYIEDMKEKAKAEVNQGIGVGDTIEICSGPYKHIEATVITEIPEEKSVQVYVELRSKQSILTLPRSVLKVVDRAPLSLYFARLGYLRAWARMAKTVFAYDQEGASLSEAYSRYEFVDAAQNRGRLLYAFIYSYPEEGPDFLTQLHDEILGKLDVLSKISLWRDRAHKLFNFIQFESFERVRLEIQTKYSLFEKVCELSDRIQSISQEVEEIARSMALGSKDDSEMVVQNVLVDGHNLAFRCLYAPGMARLTDDQGRSTGMIVGVLRSLGSLKKRYPEARFWVAWDGSSQRRKSRCADYKATRKSREVTEDVGVEKPFDPLAFLRGILSSLGVYQVWNPQEEADDVIGTLVSELEGQTNLVFSTDRDFLQLVSASTHVLYPSVGSRKEILYDVEAVQNHFGVPPEKVVQLRALFGDTSDNLSGVPRVPKKVLTRLLQEHGSVEGIYASGLAGVAKGQYERLRSAEPQVKLNLELMSLADVEVSKLDPDVDVDGVTRELRSLGIKPEPVLEAFFGRSSGPV